MFVDLPDDIDDEEDVVVGHRGDQTHNDIVHTLAFSQIRCGKQIHSAGVCGDGRKRRKRRRHFRLAMKAAREV